MPPSIDVLTSSSAPACPTALRALKSPLPSPNVMVPKQSFDTRRPVLPSVAYSMAFFFLVSPKFPWREGVFAEAPKDAVLAASGPEATFVGEFGLTDLTGLIDQQRFPSPTDIAPSPSQTDDEMLEIGARSSRPPFQR